jgi:hypothetical protein
MFFLKNQTSALPDCSYNIKISSCDDFQYKEHENKDMLVMTEFRKWLQYFTESSVTFHHDRQKEAHRKPSYLNSKLLSDI